jgi:hypothetical protein
MAAGQPPIADEDCTPQTHATPVDGSVRGKGTLTDEERAAIEGNGDMGMNDIDARLTEYCLHGGLYNPELMQHGNVRDLLIDCRSEIARLRDAIRRLADQDATLSVHGGNVTVTMDATLTADEREAIAWCAELLDDLESSEADTLRDLLARLS